MEYEYIYDYIYDLPYPEVEPLWRNVEFFLIPARLVYPLFTIVSGPQTIGDIPYTDYG